ncbi:MAG: hypothetical protein GTN77_13285 [Planctomycetales bacterium]|nr:hypothetical protein [Planctomycetales bacterium]
MEQLEAAGQLRRVQVKVAVEQEVAEITRRVCHAGGPALWFENLSDSSYPVVTNLLGSQRRIALALGGEDLRAVGRRLLGDETASPASFLQRWKNVLQAGGDHPLAPRPVTTAACQQVVRPGRDVDLQALPAVEWLPQKQYACLPNSTVISSDLEGQQRHVTAADLVIRDRKTLGIRWAPHQWIAHDWETFQQAGEKMPVAVALGGPPPLTLTAQAAIPAHCDGYLCAGLLADEPLQIATCRSLALQIPAEAEMVLEGYIDPAEPRLALKGVPDGSAGGQPGGGYHAIEVAVATSRTQPLLPVAVLSKPPNEKLHIQRGLAQIFLPIWQQAIPELVDLHYPDFAAEGMAVASFHKTFPFQARQIASALWGQAATMDIRMLVLVDQQTDLRDDQEVGYRITAHVDPRQDIFFREGPPAVPGREDDRYHSTHVALDATTKLPAERDGQAEVEPGTDQQTRLQVDQRWSEYGLD